MTELDPAIEDRIRELATLTARVTALEVLDSEIRPDIRELQKPNWTLIFSMGTAFFLTMTFMVGMEETLRSSDAQRHADSIRHLEQHQSMLEQDHRQMSLKTTSLIDLATSKMDDRLKYLERKRP